MEIGLDIVRFRIILYDIEPYGDKAMQRRKFMTLAGGGVVLAATATFGTIATRQPTDALAPWGDAGSLYDDLVF